RVTQRSFLLTPSKALNAIMAYCLAWAADKTGVLVHFCMVMSNHHHTHFTDPEARAPEFCREFHRATAQCINVLRGRSENFWASGQTSLVRLETDEAALEEIVYLLCNPVAAGLVRQGDQWPGFRTGPGDILLPARMVQRPEVFFSKKGRMPEQAALQMVRPSILTHLDDTQLVSLLQERVAERELTLQEEMARQGRRFMGARKVLRQNPNNRPRTEEVRGGIKPRVATANKQRRIEVLARDREFIRVYNEKYLAWKNGDRTVVFPAGTYARVYHGAACHPFDEVASHDTS
ncbi:MAG: hypothetical protein GXP47_13675, partial [Acidobacteria bacterium]|nr:hypothetical protein [Acidobacteriota bacterium]